MCFILQFINKYNLLVVLHRSSLILLPIFLISRHLCVLIIFYSSQRGSIPGADIYQPFFSVQAGLFLLLSSASSKSAELHDDGWSKRNTAPCWQRPRTSRFIDVNLCGGTGEEDDRGVGGCRQGTPLCAPAERGSGGSGLSGIPTGPGCPGPRPLPHQGGLQRFR